MSYNEFVYDSLAYIVKVLLDSIRVFTVGPF